MIAGLFAMVLANAAALLGARALLGPIRTGRAPVDAVLFLLLRLLLISLAILGAGVSSLLTPWGLGAASLLALAALIWKGAHRGIALPGPPPWGPCWSLATGLVALRLLVQVWLLAPHVPDSLSYHLPKVAEWVRAGAFTRELGMDPRSTFPSGFELVETWWVVFLHHDVLIEMAGVEFLLLAGAGLYALAAELGWSPRSGMAAALLFTLSPGMYFQSISCLNDGAVAALLISTTVLLVARSPAVLVLIPLGLGMGVKPTYLYSLPGLAVLAALVRVKGEPWPAAPKIALLPAAASLIVGASWYFRNALLFHNPIYPMGFGGMRSPLGGTTLQRLGPSLQSFRENLVCFLDIRIYDHNTPPDALCTGNFNGGAAAFALGVPALILILRSEPMLRKIAVGIVLSVFTVFALVELDPWYARFVLILTALPSLALGRLWERRRSIGVVASLALALQFIATMVPGNLTAETLGRMIHQGWRDRAARPGPEEPVVATCCELFGEPYSLYGPAYDRRVVYLRDETVESLLAHLDQVGARTLVVSGALPVRGAILEEAVRRGRLRPVVRDTWSGYEVLPAR
jgi:hypothetical protein